MECRSRLRGVPRAACPQSVGAALTAEQRRLLEGLATAVAGLEGARSAAATTGDEFQALYDDLPTATWSLALLRLALLDDPPADAAVEIRVGIGVGEVIGPAPVDAGSPGQSGPGWWHARAALQHVSAPRRAWPTVRWWVDGDGDVAVRATLVALHTIIAGFDAVDVSLARGLMQGRTASDLAGNLGMTPQSVGERLHGHGVYGWVRTLQTLTEDPV